MGKTLILYASAGAGHKSAAFAIKEFLNEFYPKETVVIEDILSFSNWSFKKLYTSGYLSLVKSSEHLWGYIYDLSDKELSKKEQKIRSLFNSINLYKYKKFFLKESPDKVICTHFLPLERTISLRDQTKIPSKIYCCITDYCVHFLWVKKEADGYFTGNSETLRELTYYGIPTHKISVTGIPISKKYQKKNNAVEIRKKLKISNEIPTVLCMSGGFGVGPIEQILDSFSQNKQKTQVIVVCGHNEDMKKNILRKRRKWKFPLKVLGFVNNVDELYDISDIIISKPGGLTTSEIMAKQKPLIIINPIPGQEERNSDFLLEKGIAVKVHSPRDVSFKTQEILADKKLYNRMVKMSKKYGKPNAAKDILKSIFKNER